MENMSLASKIQIGMLGVIILLLLVQMSGVLGGGSSSSLRQQAAQDLSSPMVTPTTAGAAGQTPQIQQPEQPTPPVPSGPTTSMSFKESVYDFGTINEGEKVEHIYKFTNSGSEPLVISNAKGSCGCTVPQWPKEPIAPGGTGEITVVFNSQGKKGKINNQVTLTANTNPATTTLRITGEVNAGAGSASTPAVNPLQVNPGN